MKNLKEIVYQSCDSVETSAKKVKASGIRAITQARNFSQLYYDESNILNGGMTFTSASHEPSILDEFYELKSFNLDLLVQHLHFIQDVFKFERDMLDKSVEQLLLRLDNDINNKLDMEGMQLSSLEADMSYLDDAPKDQEHKGSGKPVKASHKSISIDNSSVDLCTVCRVNTIGKKKDKGVLGSKNGVSVCTTCQHAKSKLVNSRSDVMISKHEETLNHSNVAEAKIGKHMKLKSTVKPLGSPDAKRAIGSSLEFVHVLNINNSSTTITYTGSDSYSNNSTASDSLHNNNEDSPGSMTPSRSGRFRSRLNSARSELHFLDEF